MRFAIPPSVSTAAATVTAANTNTTTTPSTHLSGRKRIIHVKYVAAKVPSHRVSSASAPSSSKAPLKKYTSVAGSRSVPGSAGCAATPTTPTASTVTACTPATTIAMDKENQSNASNANTVNAAAPSSSSYNALSPKLTSGSRLPLAKSPLVSDASPLALRRNSPHTGTSSRQTRSTPSKTPSKTTTALSAEAVPLEDLIQKMASVHVDDGLAPARIALKQLTKEIDQGKRRQILRDYAHQMKTLIVDPLYQKTTKSQKEEEEAGTTTANKNRLFAIKDVDGAFAITYTPVRMSRKKDRDAMGADSAITPVKRSLRGLATMSHTELEAKGLEQVRDVGEMFKTTGYSYTPNRYVQQ